jgi:predicted nucleic acid-binding protein
MILIDTGPLIALFDPKDPDHKACHKVLKTIEEPLYTTEAVLTEVLYVFEPGSRGAEGIKEYFLGDYVSLYALAMEDIERSFSLMNKYSDLPMDFVDPTLLALAEMLGTPRIFTLDFNDFNVYRYKKGHRYYALDLIGRKLLE